MATDRDGIERLGQQVEKMRRLQGHGNGRSMPRLSDAGQDGLQVLLSRLQERREAIPPEERARLERERAEAERCRKEDRKREREREKRQHVESLLERCGVANRERGRGMEEFTPRPHQVEAAKMVSGLLAEFLSGRRDWWLVLQGQRGVEPGNPGANGIGKSALVQAFTVSLCRDGIQAEFWPETRLIRELFRRIRLSGEDGLSEFIDHLCEIDCLAVDNMGMAGDFTGSRVTPVGEFLRQNLFDVLDTRTDDRPVLITTNLSGDEYEVRYGRDLYSRVYGMTARQESWIAFSGPDLRKEW